MQQRVTGYMMLNSINGVCTGFLKSINMKLKIFTKVESLTRKKIPFERAQYSGK